MGQAAQPPGPPSVSSGHLASRAGACQTRAVPGVWDRSSKTPDARWEEGLSLAGGWAPWAP